MSRVLWSHLNSSRQECKPCTRDGLHTTGNVKVSHQGTLIIITTRSFQVAPPIIHIHLSLDALNAALLLHFNAKHLQFNSLGCRALLEWERLEYSLEMTPSAHWKCVSGITAAAIQLTAAPWRTCRRIMPTMCMLARIALLEMLAREFYPKFSRKWWPIILWYALFNKMPQLHAIIRKIPNEQCKTMYGLRQKCQQVNSLHT